MIGRLVVCLLPLLFLGCDGDAPPPKPKPEEPAPPPPKSDVPDHIVFEQILIAFKGAYQSTAFRSRGEARELAYSIVDRIETGVGFEALKQEYSDARSKETDRALGPYYVRDDGVKPKRLDEVERRTYGPVLGHLLFQLEVGEVAIADYDEKGQPTGWHVVKRIE